MKRTLILLLFLCNNLELTSTHEECSDLPTVERAFVLDEYKKPQYQKGDVIYFSCDPGYTTGLNTTYVCTEHGWRQTNYGQCIEDTFPVRLGCTRPPALKNGHVLRNTYVYSDGDRARYQCDPLYTLKGGHFKTCSNGQWIGDLQCQATTCELPAPNFFKVQVPVGARITVQCVEEGGSEQVECLPSEQWSSTFPTCNQGCGPPPPLDNGDYLGTTTQCDLSTKAEYQCQSTYKMQGGPFKTCVNGEWSGELRCFSTCDVGLIPDSVLVCPRNAQQLQKGQRLRFRCKVGSHVLRGAQQVTCLKNRQWSHPFPSCTDPHSCGPPPSLENGDFFATNTQFDLGTRVRYECQSEHVMQGGPFKTCVNGEWTGEIRCLKPCAVTSAQMEPNKIRFLYGSANKLYAPHNGHISFVCAPGARHDGRAEMRQICNDGVMVFPRCV